MRPSPGARDLPRVAVLVLLLAGLAAPAMAEGGWLRDDSARGPSWSAVSGAHRIKLDCNDGLLMLQLYGGDTPLPPEAQDDRRRLTLRLGPDGPAREVPSSWMGLWKDRLSLTFPADPAFLDAFAKAERLTVETASGTRLFDGDNAGAENVRQGIAEACGL